MRRKVSKIGSSTLMVSLPSKWARKYHVKKGDEINIIEKKDRLILCREAVTEYRKKELNIDELGEFRKNYISHLYQSGFDEVEIRFNDIKTYEKIKDRVDNLLGFEVIEQSESRCIIKNIVSGLEEEFDNILRKIFLMLVDMIDSTYDAIKNKEYDRLNEIKDLEKMNNKFTDFCIRMLNKNNFYDNSKSYNFIKNSSI